MLFSFSFFLSFLERSYSLFSSPFVGLTYFCRSLLLILAPSPAEAVGGPSLRRILAAFRLYVCNWVLVVRGWVLVSAG